jgi:hypothetical protein
MNSKTGEPARGEVMPKTDENAIVKSNTPSTAYLPAKKIEQFAAVVGEPWEPIKYGLIAKQEIEQAEIASALTAQHIIRGGAALIIAKQNLKHGEFGPWLEEAGISERTAQKHMLLAQRAQDQGFVNPKMMNLGVSKAKELLALTNEEFEELSQHGKTGDLTLDDVDRMTEKELREAIRKSRDNQKKLEEKIKVGKQQNELLNDLNIELRKKHRAPSTLESHLYTAAMELQMALERPPVTEPGPELDMVDTACRLAYRNAHQALLKFKHDKIIKWDPPDAEKLEAEFAGMDPGEPEEAEKN